MTGNAASICGAAFLIVEAAGHPQGGCRLFYIHPVLAPPPSLNSELIFLNDSVTFMS
jgi:hypothetical protein